MHIAALLTCDQSDRQIDLGLAGAAVANRLSGSACHRDVCITAAICSAQPSTWALAKQDISVYSLLCCRFA